MNLGLSADNFLLVCVVRPQSPFCANHSRHRRVPVRGYLHGPKAQTPALERRAGRYARVLALIAYLFRCEAVIIGLNEHNMFIFNYLDKLSGIYAGDAMIKRTQQGICPVIHQPRHPAFAFPLTLR